MIKKIFIISLLTFSLNIVLLSQNTYSILVNNIPSTVITNLDIKYNYNDIESRQKGIYNILFQLYNLGYISAGIDSIYGDTSVVNVNYNIGENYKWLTLKKGNLLKHEQKIIGLKENTFNNKPINIFKINLLLKTTLNYFENNGFPFATVFLDSLYFNKSLLSATLKIEKNKFYKIDSIIIKSNQTSRKLSKTYICNYLKIKEGDVYNESLVKNIEQRLKEIPFVTTYRPFIVEFTEDKAKIVLYLDEKKANQFDGILGIMPDNNVEKKLLLTGDVKLKLINAFSQGELLDFNWKKLEANSQKLEVLFKYPFILNSPIGAEFNLMFHKKDTIYSNLNRMLGVNYQFIGENYFKAFFNHKKTILLSTFGLENAIKLPDYIDMNIVSYGIGLNLEKYDYKFNPQRGYGINFLSSVGSKNIVKNGKVNPILYDEIKLKTTKYSLIFDAKIFVPLFKRTVLMYRNNSGYMNNEQLFKNELFTLGGFKLLRGFDEESILASAYTVNTAELRYILEQNSNFYLFYDFAYYDQYTINGYVHDIPYSIGAGFSFETKAGIFSINYSVGKQFENQLNFSSSKIHFGIINQF